MGGLLHLFDFHNNSFSRRVFSHHKTRDEDLEAPRNSFELQVDNLHTFHNDKDKPQSYGFEEDEWYERSSYPIEESMKKKIIEELSKRSTDKHNSPSLVAKLMGMEALPLESTKSTAWINPRHTDKVDHSHEKGGGKRNKKERRLASLAVNVMETDDINVPPMRREHPQEEELQRFRREFEAWQADKRSKDCSRIIDSGSVAAAKDEKERLFTRTRSFGRDFNLKSDRTGPTRIVVLRPGLQRVYDYEDSLTTSSGTTMEGSRGSSIEEFLEEVKERLKGELQGRAALKRSSSVRGSGIETPFSERPFPRSESMRSYAASEVQCTAPDSPLQEFISKDTRRLLAERVSNVLRKEMSSSSSRLRPTVSDAESLQKHTDEIEEETRRNRSVSKKEPSSPRNLKRSLSAPVSGTSFGKLLLEDRHVLTGAQIMRKHEAVITEGEETETEPVVVDPIRRKERFNLRKKVSSFRSTLRGRIFGKKIRSMIESNSFEDESIKDFVTGSRFNSFYDRNENSTEVPPSPASVCSSTPEEFWKNVDYLSQVSTPDVTVSDENGMPQVFRDISSNLSELRRQINELDSDIQVPTPVEEEAAREIEITIDLGNPDKTFVRDLLVASGLYEGTTDRSLSRWDPFAKPINKSVLEDTKENLKKRNNPNQEEEEDTEDNHNILFDLLNEVLTVVLGPMTKSGFKKKLMNSCVSESAAIRGKYLLESVWRIMSEYLYSQPEKPFCSLDGIIGWDLERCPWSGLIGEEAVVLGKEVEGMIMSDLVEEVVKDLRAQMV
ncbi:RB1-inducible coiled-coil protein [Hirschfeldia incana]|nr:RB1-inducible coiled-coil protein [Hirschfeldia incana]